MKTKVIFRIYPTKEVIALFPEIPGNNNPYTCDSYLRVGQHGAADPELVVSDTKLATEEEYASFKRELESTPYEYEFEVISRLRSIHIEARRRELTRHCGMQAA